MKRISLVVLMFTASAAWATPPQEVKAHYDHVRGGLKIDAKHISDDQSKHFIRRVVIKSKLKNMEAESFSFSSQKNPTKFDELVPYQVTVGDMLYVTLSCSEGGKREVEVFIPPPTIEEVEMMKGAKGAVSPDQDKPKQSSKTLEKSMATPAQSSY